MPVRAPHMDYTFYFRPDGTREPITELLDCLGSPLYFAAHQRYGELPDPYAIFLVDPAVRAVPREGGGFSSINLANRRPLDHIFEFDRSVSNPWEVSLEIMERRLDAGEMLIVQTHTSVIPFFKAYDPCDSLLPYFGAGSSHLFLIVGHDDEHYFYVDMPCVTSEAGYVEHPDNPYIGVAKKEAMYPAFMRQLDFCSVITQDGFFRDYDPDRECLAFMHRVLDARDTARTSGEPEAIASIVDYLEATDLAAAGATHKQVLDTAYSLFFLTLEIIYKHKIWTAALAHSPSGRFARDFPATVAGIEDVIKAWWPVSEIVSPFNRPEVDFSQKDRLIVCLREAAAAEARLYADLRREYDAGTAAAPPG